MRSRAIVFSLAVGVLVPLGSAQNSSQDELPSAPSAVIIEKQQQAGPAPKPKPAESPKPQSAPPSQPTTSQPSATEATSIPAPPAGASAGASPASAPPPSSNTADDSPLATIRKLVDEVNVIFTVTDKRGRYVKNMTKDDFRILDDKTPQRQVVNFRSETDLPLRVGLLIDASNSVRDRFKFEQAAAIEFLNQIIRSRYDRAFTIGFDTTPEVTQDFTDNSELLSRGVHNLRPGGGTAMYDALYYACRDKLAKTGADTGVRRAVILLSDGEDNQSHVTREEAIEMAQKAEVIVYVISTNVSGMKGHGDKVLDRIADATGGRAFFPFKVEDLANAFTEIQEELRSQYSLAYRPADFQRDGRYHSIEILAQKQKGLHVRSRKGYYAPSQ
jgi:VWFA-related protein